MNQGYVRMGLVSSAAHVYVVQLSGALSPSPPPAPGQPAAHTSRRLELDLTTIVIH